MANTNTTLAGDLYCRSCGFTDCASITENLGYCPRWQDPPVNSTEWDIAVLAIVNLWMDRKLPPQGLIQALEMLGSRPAVTS